MHKNPHHVNQMVLDFDNTTQESGHTTRLVEDAPGVGQQPEYL